MKTLSTIITYAMCVNVFFYLLEIFTAFYSGIPGHQHSILYLFTGHDGHMAWINSWMWTAVVFAVLSLLMLIPPALRYNDKILPWALILLVIASWIDKSLACSSAASCPTCSKPSPSTLRPFLKSSSRSASTGSEASSSPCSGRSPWT